MRNYAWMCVPVCVPIHIHVGKGYIPIYVHALYIHIHANCINLIHTWGKACVSIYICAYKHM